MYRSLKNFIITLWYLTSKEDVQKAIHTVFNTDAKRTSDELRKLVLAHDVIKDKVQLVLNFADYIGKDRFKANCAMVSCVLFSVKKNLDNKIGLRGQQN